MLLFLLPNSTVLLLTICGAHDTNLQITESRPDEDVYHGLPKGPADELYNNSPMRPVTGLTVTLQI